MNIKTLVKLLFACVIVAAASIFTAAQDGVKSRSITSEDFAKQRPADASVGGKKLGTLKSKRFVYKFARAEKNVFKVRPKKTPAPKTSTVKMSELGVTMWKLRPPTAAEARFVLLPVNDDKGERQMWLPERVDTTSIFHVGDRVRFAVETSDSGYIYVLGRETYSDGSYGDPYPIFPTSPTEDNSVRPGMLFDFPDQRDDIPYLKFTSKKENHSGELLTVIVSPRQLTSIKIDDDGNLKSTNELADMEYGADFEVFSRTDNADRIFTKNESKATCGVKTRELVREKSADYCGSHQLTRGEPHPQSIYRIKGFMGQPAVAMVRLTVQP